MCFLMVDSYLSVLSDSHQILFGCLSWDGILSFSDALISVHRFCVFVSMLNVPVPMFHTVCCAEVVLSEQYADCCRVGLRKLSLQSVRLKQTLTVVNVAAISLWMEFYAFYEYLHDKYLHTVLTIVTFHNCMTRSYCKRCCGRLARCLLFDNMVEFWLKIMQFVCPDVKAHSIVMCGSPHRRPRVGSEAVRIGHTPFPDRR